MTTELVRLQQNDFIREKLANEKNVRGIIFFIISYHYYYYTIAKNLVNNNKAAKQFSRLPTYSIVEMRRKYRCQLYLFSQLFVNERL